LLHNKHCLSNCYMDTKTGGCEQRNSGEQLTVF
jgi:hypothetical protein